MTRLPLVDPATASGPTADLFATVQRTLGATPNMTKAMANSRALLKGYVELSGALSRGVLPAGVREQIALAVAQSNGCSYCLSAHTYLGENVAKLDTAELTAARKAVSADRKVAAILRLAVAVNDSRGDLAEDELDEARAAGVSDEEIAEVIGHVALNVLTNYFNKAADTQIDFPVVSV